MTTAGCGCQYDASGRPFVDRCVCTTPATPTDSTRDRIMRAIGGWYALGAATMADASDLRIIGAWQTAVPPDRVTLTYDDGPPLTNAGIVVSDGEGGRMNAFLWIPSILYPGDRYTFVPRDCVRRFRDGHLS